MKSRQSRSALRRWLTAGAVNEAGTLATLSVLPVVVYRATHDPFAVGVLSALQAAPYLVLGLAAGQLADRTGRQRLMVVGLVLAAGVAAVQAFGLATGPHLAVLYACALLTSTVFVVTDAAHFGLVPDLLRPEELARGWGLAGSLGNAVEIFVPPLALSVLAVAGAAAVVGADAVSYLVAAVLIARVVPVVSRPADTRGRGPAGPGWTAGVTFIRRHPTLRWLVLAGFFNSAGFGLVNALLVVYAADALGLTTAGPRLGVLLAAAAVGGAVAGLTFDRVYRGRRVRALTLVGTAGSALAVGLVAVTASFVAAVCLLIGYGGLLGLTISTGITYRQEVAPDQVRSRVMVVGRMVAWGGQPFGAAVGGLLARSAGVAAAYLLAAALFVAATAVATRIPRGAGAGHPRRRLRIRGVGDIQVERLGSDHVVADD